MISNPTINSEAPLSCHSLFPYWEDSKFKLKWKWQSISPWLDDSCVRVQIISKTREMLFNHNWWQINLQIKGSIFEFSLPYWETKFENSRWKEGTINHQIENLIFEFPCLFWRPISKIWVEGGNSDWSLDWRLLLTKLRKQFRILNFKRGSRIVEERNASIIQIYFLV